MSTGPLFLASFKGHEVVVDLASGSEVAALDGPLETVGVRNVLSPWSLIAIRVVGTGERVLHALGWREAEENTWITSALVTVDPVSSLILTSSGRLYRLGAGGGGLDPSLLDHLDYALRTWGFTDVR